MDQETYEGYERYIYIGIAILVIIIVLYYLTRKNNEFDIVITWVDWSNKHFVQKMIEAGGRSEGCDVGEFMELKYLLRSLVTNNIPYRNIYIVYSDNHPPPKFLQETSNLFFIKHSQIVKDPTNLPLIHRETIVSHLHNIPGLSRYFFYIEDDIIVNDKDIFKEVLNDYVSNNIVTGILPITLNPPYNVREPMGLWYHCTSNSINLIETKIPYKQTHHIVLLDKDILTHLDQKFPTHMKVTQSYKNQKTEISKEPYLISTIDLHFNYLIHKKGYTYSDYVIKNSKEIHTNGYSSYQNDKDMLKTFLDNLHSTKQYKLFNAQGDGISDEYPKADKVHDIFYNYLEQMYPTKTIYEK